MPWRHKRGLDPTSLLVSIFSGMPVFHHGSVELAFLDEGLGAPIGLVHGFASSKEVYWVHPGWFATLHDAGRRVIALDNGGHGGSTEIYYPSDYDTMNLEAAAAALLYNL